MTNIFLDGLPNEDFRDWKYDEDCNCKRCRDFYEAAYYIVGKNEGFDPPKP